MADRLAAARVRIALKGVYTQTIDNFLAVGPARRRISGVGRLNSSHPTLLPVLSLLLVTRTVDLEEVVITTVLVEGAVTSQGHPILMRSRTTTLTATR